MEMYVIQTQAALTTLVPIAAVFLLLAFAVKRGQVREAYRRSRRESLTNLSIWILNYIILVPVFFFPVFLIREALPDFGGLQAFWAGLPLPLTILVSIFVVDFCAYWRHRLEHRRSLWRIHATHHADEAMTWFSVVRKHPLSHWLAMLLDTPLALAIGLPVEAVAVAMVIRSWWGHFIHADVPWTLGPLGLILISPAAHRLHHIRDERLMGYNYANTITLWDRMFGTWLNPAPYVDCETGIAEGTRDFLGELKRPWEKHYRLGSNGESAIGPVQTH